MTAGTLRVVVDARPVNPGLTGIGRYAMGLLHSLDLVGGHVEVSAVIGPEGAEMMSGLQRVGLIVAERAGEEWTHRDLPDLLRRMKAHVLHSPLFVLPRAPGCACVTTIHDVIPRARPDLSSREFNAFFEAHAPRAARESARVVTPSEFSARDIERHLPEAAGRTVVILEPVGEQFRRPEPERMTRVLRGLGLDAGYVLFVGSLDRRKGMVTLLDAWSILVREGRDVPPLVLAGGFGGAALDVESEIRRRGIVEKVKLLGRVEDRVLPALYAGASLFVFPTYYEGFGLPVPEAMACGTPVVSSRTTSIPEVAGDAAILTTPGEPLELSRAISLILHDGALRTDLVLRGARRAAEFSLARQAESLRGLYESIALEAR